MSTGTQTNTSMDIGFDNPEEAYAGGFTPAPPPGFYHVIVSEAELRGMKKDGTISNSVKIGFSILAGTVANQVGGEFHEYFTLPSASNRDGGVFLTRRLGLLAIATGLHPAPYKGEVGGARNFDFESIDWPNMVGRHLVVEVINEESESNGKKYVNAKVGGLNIFHVRDPRVEQNKCPLDGEMMTTFDMGENPWTAAEKRKAGSGQVNQGGNGNGAAATAGQPAQPAKAPATTAPTSTAKAYADID